MRTDKHVITSTPAVAPRFAIVVIVALAVSMVTLVLIQRLIRPNNTLQAGASDSAPATQEFIPGQAMTVKVNTITVFAPADAINMAGSIFIMPREPDLFPSASQPGWRRPQVVDVEFRNTEGAPVPNILFSAPIQICFQLTEEQWDDFVQRPGFYEVQYYAAERKPPVWEKLPMMTKPDLRLLCGQTQHLSLFALAIKSETGIPVTGPTVTPTPTPTATRTQPSPWVRPTREEPMPTDTPLPTSTLEPTQPPPTESPTTEPTPTEPPPTEPLPTLPLPTIGP